MIKVKNIIFSFITILSATLAHASDNRLTKEEFLSKVDNGKIQLEREMVFNLPSNILAQEEDKIKLTYPAFKSEMFYVGYIKDNKVMYSLFFNWTYPQCELRIEELDAKTGKASGKTADVKGQKVDKKYCAKFLGINL